MRFDDGFAAIIFVQGSARAAHVRVHTVVFRAVKDDAAQHRGAVGIAHLPPSTQTSAIIYTIPDNGCMCVPLQMKMVCNCFTGRDQIGHPADRGNNKKTVVGSPVVGDAHKNPTGRGRRQNEKVNVGHQEHRPRVG